jgi:hypothetical protein
MRYTAARTPTCTVMVRRELENMMNSIAISLTAGAL